MLACLASAHADTSFQGPADLRNQRPYQLLFLGFSPQSASVLPDGRTRVSAQFDIANDVLAPSPKEGAAVREDTETQRLALSYARGVGGGFEASAIIPVVARNGGVLDKLAETYHRLVGFDHPTRDVYFGRRDLPSYQSVVSFDRPGGDSATFGAAFGLGDTQLTLKHALLRGLRTGVAARLGITLPTGDKNHLLGSGGVDYGADLDVDQMLSSRLAVYANLSAVQIGRDSALGNAARSSIYHTSAALEYVSSSSSSWILQTEEGSAAVRTGNAFADGTQSTIAVAYRRRSSHGVAWTYACTENGDLFNYGAPSLAQIGPDITFSVGWEKRD
ncbi:hypothetical protein CCAX7_11190 [Capsulimonas corticalis]|uniref:DUF3187 family protein n=2 Tax=Capsulimonas corticalis TaxID=2219043 RepID=A0A9N7KZ36_9BACT|nr:hypothetical protein CCAX7_11190 [Capsulimonas corticalis]